MAIIISLLFLMIPFKALLELRKSLKMLIWVYNGKYYWEINDVKIRELPGEIEFKKDNPYIID